MSSDSSFSVSKGDGRDVEPIGRDEASSKPLSSLTVVSLDPSCIHTKNNEELGLLRTHDVGSDSAISLHPSLLSSFDSDVIETEVHPTDAKPENVKTTMAFCNISEKRGDESKASEGATIITTETPETLRSSDSNRETNRVLDDGLQPGTMFGQFRIIRYVGGGGMGHVYEGFDCDLERTVAIKVLPRRKAADEAVVARFLNEAKSSARLNHENIAQVYLFGNVAGIPYIAFEYVEGVNLRDYVRNNGVLELSEAIDYILQTASALAHAASHGVTHRDVKPSNILVTVQKRVKLIDMGLARLLRTTEAYGDLTESGVTLGTFDYISPEQAKDPRLADVRSDVYSLGCTFYYILAGTPPFPNGTVLQKLLQHQGDEAPDIREMNPSVPVEIVSVIRKMMRKNPDERYQTPDLLIKDLVQIVDMLGINVSDRGYVDEKSAVKSKTTIPLLALPAIGAVLFLLTFVVTFYVLNSEHELRVPAIAPSPVVMPSSSGEENGFLALDELESASDSAGINAKLSSELGGDSSVQDNIDAQRLSSVVEYTSADIDAIYTAAYMSPPDKITTDFIDEIRSELNIENELGKYITCSETVADSCRVAFGCRAASLNHIGVNSRESTSSFDSGSTSDCFSTNCGGLLLQESDMASFAVTAYSTLGAVRTISSTEKKLIDLTLVVDGQGDDTNAYPTLAAAISAASNSANGLIHIELRIADSLEVSPLSLVDKNVEIVAAEGMRPTLVFKPSETPDGGWGERMFLLDSSKLLLNGVDIDFTVPSQEVVSSEWSVFEALGSSELKIFNSTLTVSNMTGSSFTAPLHSNVAFFRASDDSLLNPVFDPQASLSYEGDSLPVFNATLENVLARGEASLFVVKKSGGRYEVKNSGVNVSGPLLQYIENDSAVSRGGDRFVLDFDHVAFLSRSCLVRFDSEATMSAANVSLTSSLEMLSSIDSGSGTDSVYLSASELPPFSVLGRNSVLFLGDQPLALVTTPAIVEQDVFRSEWKLDKLLTLDVSSFWRRRTVRSDTWQDFTFIPADFNSESHSLAKLNIDAHERLESIPPHLFSISDFSNWIFSPIRTSSELNSTIKEVGEEINADFLEAFPE